MKKYNMTTFNGRRFNIMEPIIDDIDLGDIIQSLSNQCRFAGHCDRFYSVAQHSVNVAHLVADEFKPWALFHDAAEAYISDIPRPVRNAIPTLDGIESRILFVIAGRYSLSWPIPKAVLIADDLMLAIEINEITNDQEQQKVPDLEGKMIELESWDPITAYFGFLSAIYAYVPAVFDATKNILVTPRGLPDVY